MVSVWHRRFDRAWRDRGLRQQFELETGLAPLAHFFEHDLIEKQKKSGHTAAYEHVFKAWVSKRLGIQGIAPEEYQEFFLMSEDAQKAS